MKMRIFLQALVTMNGITNIFGSYRMADYQFYRVYHEDFEIEDNEIVLWSTSNPQLPTPAETFIRADTGGTELPLFVGSKHVTDM